MVSIRGLFRRNGKEVNYLPASLTHRRKEIVFAPSCPSVKIANRCGGLSGYHIKKSMNVILHCGLFIAANGKLSGQARCLGVESLSIVD